MSRKPRFPAPAPAPSEAPAEPGVIRDVFGDNPIPMSPALRTPAEIAVGTLLDIAQNPAADSAIRVAACEVLVAPESVHNGLLLGVLVALSTKNSFGNVLAAQVSAARLILKMSEWK